jgi:multidrug efflux pump
VGDVVDGNENIRNAGIANGKPSVLVILNRSPGANIIDTVDRVYALLPELQAAISPAIDITPAADRSVTIRASLTDVERTLMISVVLVIFVVFVFLRSGRATLVPSVAVPVSLVGTFAAMYMLDYSLDNLSLMALTVATGFVVDDAIVVLENISRHVEAGVPRVQAAIRGAGEVAFTVMSMTISLIAVFIPILLMGGIVGRLFREFAVTLSVALMVSLTVSLATTPMMCALLLRRAQPEEQGRFHRTTERVFDAMLRGYDRSLTWALKHPRLIMLILLVTVVTNVELYRTIPKGFFPQQDTGRIVGNIQADQSVSFQLMRQKLQQFVEIISKDPAVDAVVGFTGGGQTNGGNMFMSLKPLRERRISADQVIARLSRELAQVPGATLFLQAVQDIRVGGRAANAQYQYTLQADTVEELYLWAPRILAELQKPQKVPVLTQVNSDQQNKGLETDITIDRDTAARLGVTVAQIDNTLYDAFGQRQVSTIYNARNQYHVVMEVAPAYWQNPDTLKDVYVSKSGGGVGGTQGTNAVAGTVRGATTATSAAASVAADAARNLALNSIGNTGKGVASTGAAVSTSAEPMVPLSAVTSYGPGNIPLAVTHQGLFVASTISFNLEPGASLSDAVAFVNEAMTRLGVPATIHGNFQGTARAFQQSLNNQPWLILAALVAIYIVLGVLYESYIHPITILSTLPSAGVGAVLALMICNTEFSIMGLIGVILLIGLVKKNAIMMIDFALDAERTRGLAPEQAIYEACLLRFRPIMMTTSAALFGALPLAIGMGDGSELRRPLGIAIVGGLMLSQLLTLYTTPVVYIYLDRFSLWLRGRRGQRRAHGAPDVTLAPGE